MILQYPYQIIKIINKLSLKEITDIINDDYNLAFLLYYYKRLEIGIQKLIFGKMFRILHKYNKNYQFNYSFGFKNYPHKVRELIINNLGFYQLSFGCSKGCYFCGCDAPYFNKPLSIPYNQIKYLIKNHKKDLKKNYSYFYWASDPLDYIYGNKGYCDILKVYKNSLQKLPYTSTSLNKSNYYLYKQLEDKINRVSYLGTSKDIYKSLEYKIAKSPESISSKEVWSNGLNGYRQNKYDHGILCLNGTLVTPFFAYNLVNLGICNNYFPQGLSCYPIKSINDSPIIAGNDLISYLSNKIVMYDYIDHRINNGFNKIIVVFLRDYKNIYMLICSTNLINRGVIKIESSNIISEGQYYKLCFTLEGYNILQKIEANE